MPDPITTHVGFTGSRKGMTEAQANKLVDLIRPYRWLHHGDCLGADSQAHDIAKSKGLRIHIHGPLQDAFRAWRTGDASSKPWPYMVRNRDIVDATCRLIAAPNTTTEQLRSGTWATIRYAQKVGKPVSIVFPDGRVRDE